MHSLMIGWEFPPKISGGLGVACHALVQALARQHVRVTLILPQAIEPAPVDPNYVKVIGCNHLQNLQTLIRTQGALSALYGDQAAVSVPYETAFFSTPRLSPRLIEHTLRRDSLLRAIDVEAHYGKNLFSEVLRYAALVGTITQGLPHDLIHAHDWLTILAALEVRCHSGKPVIFHVHALESDRSGEESINPVVAAIEKYGAEQADHLIAVSQYTKNQIVKHYHIDPAKISVIHNGVTPLDGVTTAPLSIKPFPEIVLFVGRITHQKGPLSFVRIAQKVLEHRPKVHFVVAGNGNLLREMIEAVAAAKIGDRVHFTGFLAPEVVKTLYRLADVYVMPSVSEPFGIACLEALSRGVPAVISRQSGVSEVTAHVLRAEFWDTDAMAGHILALLEYPALKREIVHHAVSDSPRWSWDEAGKKIVRLYEHHRSSR